MKNPLSEELADVLTLLLKRDFLSSLGRRLQKLNYRTIELLKGWGKFRVIIYGEHSPDWMTALGPQGPVWRLLPKVAEVIIVPGTAQLPLTKFRKRLRRTVIIPLMEQHTRHCPRTARTLMPDHQTLEILADKLAFAGYVREHQLEHYCPKFFATPEEAEFPCVLKRPDLNAGNGIEMVSSPTHLRELLVQELWQENKWLLQAYVPGGKEYVTHCVCKGGKILWHCSFLYEHDGSSVIRRWDTRVTTRAVPTDPRHLSQFQELLAPISYDGPCNIDYKISTAGDLLVFEINPRFGGSLMPPEHIGYLRGALAVILENAT